MLHQHAVQPCCVMLRFAVQQVTSAPEVFWGNGACLSLPKSHWSQLMSALGTASLISSTALHWPPYSSDHFCTKLLFASSSWVTVQASKIATYLCCFSSDLLAMNTLARLHKQKDLANMQWAACNSHTRVLTWLLKPCMFRSPVQPAAMQLCCPEVRLLLQLDCKTWPHWLDNAAHIASSDQESLALLAGHGFRLESCNADTSHIAFGTP